MEYEELKSYLKDVYEAERQIYSLREIANLYENELERLNGEYNTLYVCEPIFGETKKSHTIVKPPKDLYDVEKLVSKLLVYGKDGIDFPFDRWDIIKDVTNMLERYKKRRLFKTYYPPEIYEKGSALSNEIIECYSRYYNNDLEVKRTHLLPFCEKTKKEYTEQVLEILVASEKLLSQLYAQDIIHPKYRNFLAIAQIYEYLDTGRCTELVGPNGAYNLYEQELRQNTIIDKLDVIITQLEMLNRTMSYVASAINQSNSLLREISSSLGRIEANTALTSYNTQCIAYNTNIANRYNY